MPLEPPNLDDRRFADIIAEAKTLIPRYAPEWTNYNDSDPGIALLQLFAWMTDMQIFRLNQVPELNYIKFLQLLGIELQPAQPARADLTFTLARKDVEFVIVPQGTLVAVGDTGGQPLLFETDAALIALGANLDSIQSFDGFGYSVATLKNSSSGQTFAPFGSNAREGSALLLGFDSPIDFTDQQVNLAVIVQTAGLQTNGVSCDTALMQAPLAAGIVWEYWDGLAWQPLSLNKDETRAFTRSGHVLFSGPGSKASRATIGSFPDPRYWMRARLAQSSYEQAPVLESVLTNTTSATQAQTVQDEVVGGSDGTPNQTFQLANAPILVLDKAVIVQNPDGTRATITSLRLEVDEGSGFQVWQEVDDFLASGPDDPHYTLNKTTGSIVCGDGDHGRILTANLNNPAANIVARLYRYGGGKQGNVGAGTIQELQTSVPGVSAVTNLLSALGGAEEETVADAKLRAPLALKSKDRAVTAEDFEFIAIETPGVQVRRAKALPLMHPQFRGTQIPGVISVIVVPDSDAPNPLPNEATLRIVCACLNQHRLLTSEVYVIPPTYHKVLIEADIIVSPDADLAETRQAVVDNLTQYFHPLTGGENGTGWEFGGTLFYSQVYRVLLQTAGVDRINDNQLVIWLDDERQAFCRDVPIEADSLLYSDGHTIRVAYA